MRKRIKIIFTLSVLLNVVFIALAAGTVYKFNQHAEKPLMDIRANLSEDARQTLRSKMRDGVRAQRDHQQKAKAYQQDMQKILSAEKFDREGYTALAEKLSNLNAQRSQERIKKTADLMESLSPGDRQAMAKHIAKRLSGERMMRDRSRMRDNNGR